MKLKSILLEIIKEDYPANWDWEKFKSLNGFAAKKREITNLVNNRFKRGFLYEAG